MSYVACILIGCVNWGRGGGGEGGGCREGMVSAPREMPLTALQDLHVNRVKGLLL